MPVTDSARQTPLDDGYAREMQQAVCQLWQCPMDVMEGSEYHNT